MNRTTRMVLLILGMVLIAGCVNSSGSPYSAADEFVICVHEVDNYSFFYSIRFDDAMNDGCGKFVMVDPNKNRVVSTDGGYMEWHGYYVMTDEEYERNVVIDVAREIIEEGGGFRAWPNYHAIFANEEAFFLQYLHDHIQQTKDLEDTYNFTAPDDDFIFFTDQEVFYSCFVESNYFLHCRIGNDKTVNTWERSIPRGRV